jgi:hypothetical protein
MIGMVCSSCHGLAFSLASILEEEQVEVNFRRRPSRPAPSLAMVKPPMEPTKGAVR